MTGPHPALHWTHEDRLLCAGALPAPVGALELSEEGCQVSGAPQPRNLKSEISNPKSPAPGSNAALAAALRAPLVWGRVVERAWREGTACILLKRLEMMESGKWRMENGKWKQGASASLFPDAGHPSSVVDSPFSIPASALERLREMRVATLAKNVRLGHRLREIDGALARRGVSALLLKGAYLVRAVYGDPGLRGMGDVDVLVAPEALAEAAEALRDAGFSPLGPLPRGAPAQGLYLNSMVFGSDGDGGVIHLHWHWLNASFPILPYGARLDPDALRAGARSLPGFRALAVPEPEPAVLHLCEHAFKHAYDALVRLVDVVTLWRAAAPDAGRVGALARRWGLERPAGITLRLCGAYFGWEAFASPRAGDGSAAAALSEALLDGAPVARAEARFVRRAMDQCRGRARSYPVYLAWQEGVRGKVNFLARTLFPPQEDLRRIENLDRLPGIADYAGRVWRGIRFALRP